MFSILEGSMNASFQFVILLFEPKKTENLGRFLVA